MYSISSRISYRIKVLLNRANKSWDKYTRIRMSRLEARLIRKEIIADKGKSVVTTGVMKEIKKYCRETFGSSAYWPWLAVYTEQRGEFKKGWMPYEYYRYEMLPQVNPDKYREFSECKHLDYKLFNDSIIEPVFFRSNGLYFHKKGSVLKKSQVDEILENIDNELVIKAASGGGGKSVMFKQPSEVCLEELPEKSDLVFQKAVKQHSELEKLYPHSVNTFRVFTYLDDEGAIKIKFIIIRFGRNGSRIDNCSSGGGWVFVYPDGRVAPMAYNEYGYELGTTHSDTGTEFSKLNLPFLDKVKELCKKSHRTFPYTRIVGWDVYIDEEGTPKLIEWNAETPGFWGFEACFGPFLEELLPTSTNKSRDIHE